MIRKISRNITYKNKYIVNRFFSQIQEPIPDLKLQGFAVDKSDLRLIDLYNETKSRIFSPPRKPSNSHFGVGPIMQPNSATLRQEREQQFAFAAYVEDNYGIAIGTQNQMMHRQPEGLKATHDILFNFFQFIGSPKNVHIGIVSGSGYGGFATLTSNILDPTKKLYIDTLNPREVTNGKVGAFRHRWARDLVARYESVGCFDNIVFAKKNGCIPSAQELVDMDIKFIVGVGNETTGCTKFNKQDLQNIYDWVDKDPLNHHPIIDITSLLGGIDIDLSYLNFFSPPQKVGGGVAGISILGIKKETAAHMSSYHPPWHIEAVFDIAPVDPIKKERSILGGPFFNPETCITGPVINTKHILGLMQSSFALRNIQNAVGDCKAIIKKSEENLAALEKACKDNDILAFANQDDISRRSNSTALLLVIDDTITTEQKRRAVRYAKDYLGYKGLMRPNGVFIKGLQAMDNLETYPGTPGDFRFWIGGIRPKSDMEDIIKNLDHAYYVGKAIVIEEELADRGVNSSGDLTEEHALDNQNNIYNNNLINFNKNNAKPLKPINIGPLTKDNIKLIAGSEGEAISKRAQIIFSILGFANPSVEKELSTQDCNDLHDALLDLAELTVDGRPLRKSD